MEGNKEGKGQVYGREKCRYMEGKREGKSAGICKGIGRGKGRVYGRERKVQVYGRE